MLTVSSNGGQSFSAATVVNTVAYDNNGQGTQERDSAPRSLSARDVSPTRAACPETRAFPAVR